MCYVTGSGLEEAMIRGTAYFTIHACDQHGTQARGGGERFRVVFRGRSAPEWTLHDNGDGTYAGSYTASVSGEYEMLVLLDGVAINGSPFRLVVKAGIAAPEHCLPSGEGLSESYAGERARLHVKAIDTNGLPKQSGGDAFEVMLHGPVRHRMPDAAALALAPVARFRLNDLRNGGYQGHYTLNAAGTYLLLLQEETTGTPLEGSPFRVTVHPGPLHAPSCALTPIDPLCTTVAGGTAMVDVSLMDAYGNELTHDAARSLRVRFAASEAHAEAERKREQAAARPLPQRGPLSPPAKLRGGFGHACAAACTPPPRGAGGVTGDFEYEDEDAFGAAGVARGGPQPTSPYPGAKSPGPRATLGVAECKLKPVDINGQSVTRLAFRPTRAGPLRVAIMYGNELLGGRPLNWAVEAAESHRDGCTVRGVGASECVAGELATFNVFMRDRFGNAVTSGGDVVSAELRGQHFSPVAAQVVDMRTGEYRVSYTASVGGLHELHVFVRTEPVYGSPFMLTVHAARTAAAACDVDASDLAGVRVSVAAPFTIIAYDRHKNRALRGGDRFRAILRPPDGGRVDVPLTDHGDGSYSGSVVPRVTGAHYLEAFLDNSPLPGCPYTISVDAGPARPMCSTARANFLRRAADSWPDDGTDDTVGALDISDGGDPRGRPTTLRSLTAGEEATIALIAMDENGNPSYADPAEWDVVCQPLVHTQGAEVSRPRISFTQDGSDCCDAAVALPVAGRYACTVVLRGEEVNGSPFGIEVLPGPVDATRSGLGPSGLPRGCAGQEGRLLLVLRDSLGNQIRSGVGHRLAVQLRCPTNGLAQRAAVVDHGDGSYLVRFRPEVAVEHEVHAWLLQRSTTGEEAAPLPLRGSPYALRVTPGALSCGMSGEAEFQEPQPQRLLPPPHAGASTRGDAMLGVAEARGAGGRGIAPYRARHLLPRRFFSRRRQGPHCGGRDAGPHLPSAQRCARQSPSPVRRSLHRESRAASRAGAPRQRYRSPVGARRCRGRGVRRRDRRSHGQAKGRRGRGRHRRAS